MTNDVKCNEELVAGVKVFSKISQLWSKQCFNYSAEYQNYKIAPASGMKLSSNYKHKPNSSRLLGCLIMWASPASIQTVP